MESTQTKESGPVSSPWHNLLSLLPFKLEFNFPWLNNFLKNFAPKPQEEASKPAAQKPDEVKIVDSNPPPPPISISTASPDQDFNPLALIPVYAIGGFIIFKWAMARWKENQSNGKKDKDVPTEDVPDSKSVPEEKK